MCINEKKSTLMDRIVNGSPLWVYQNNRYTQKHTEKEMTIKDLKALALVIPGFLLAFMLTPEPMLPEAAAQMNVLGSEFTTQVTMVIGGIFLLLGVGRAVIENVVE